jgi:hypothetical protein
VGVRESLARGALLETSSSQEDGELRCSEGRARITLAHEAIHRPQTAVRFHIVSRVGAGLRSPRVAEECGVARSTVVRAAHSFAAEGLGGLYDKRHGSEREGRPRAPNGLKST